MNRIYGYCRVSTARQNIDRQVRNILAAFPDAVIVQEVYTGTKFQVRKELEKILSRVQERDSIVFDSVSRFLSFSESANSPNKMIYYSLVA